MCDKPTLLSESAKCGFSGPNVRKHELSAKDKKLIEAVLGKPPEADSPEWNVLPCDVLHGESLCLS